LELFFMIYFFCKCKKWNNKIYGWNNEPF
jgi:hypothetical protein